MRQTDTMRRQIVEARKPHSYGTPAKKTAAKSCEEASVGHRWVTTARCTVEERGERVRGREGERA